MTRNILRCTPPPACLNPELTSLERRLGCMAGEPLRWEAVLLTHSGSYVHDGDDGGDDDGDDGRDGLGVRLGNH